MSIALRGMVLIILAWPLVMPLAGCARSTAGADARAPARSASAVPVLMYHEIGVGRTPPGETAIRLERFQEQMDFLADHGYTTLSVGQLVGFLGGRPVPERSIALTFDDGWKSVEGAVPVLKKHGFKATFFIITGAADGRFGPDYLSWQQIESLAREPLFEIGSHSVTHPWNPADSFLTWCEGKPVGKGIGDVRLELVKSKEVLEAHLHKRIDYWAWPCGWTNEQLTGEARKAGYRVQLTTIEEPNVPGVSPSEIRRYFVDGTWEVDTFARFLGGATQASPRRSEDRRRRTRLPGVAQARRGRRDSSPEEDATNQRLLNSLSYGEQTPAVK